jgi:hypothetical protein
MKDETELCAIKLFRETWKTLNESKDLEEAKQKYKQLVLNLILP